MRMHCVCIHEYVLFTICVYRIEFISTQSTTNNFMLITKPLIVFQVEINSILHVYIHIAFSFVFTYRALLSQNTKNYILCMYTCIYVVIHIGTSRISTCIHILCIHTCICTMCIYVCIHVYVFCIYIVVYVCVHTYTCIFVYMYVCIQTHVSCMYTCMYYLCVRTAYM